MCSSQTSIAITLVKVGVFTHLVICFILMLACCVYVFEGFLGCMCFVGFGLGRILDVLMLF